jgi:hypothetical protein
MKYSETDKSSYMKADNTFNKVMDEVNRFEKVFGEGKPLEKALLSIDSDISHLKDVRDALSSVYEALEQAHYGTMAHVMMDESKSLVKSNQEIKESVLDDSDDDGFMARSQLYFLAKDAISLHSMIDDREDLEPWVQSKIAQASQGIDAVRRYTEYNATKGAQEVPVQADIPQEGVTEEEDHDIVDSKTHQVNADVALAGDSIWSDSNPPAVKVSSIKVNKQRDGYVDVKVEHDGPWEIYTDSGFEKNISALIGIEVDFSEQGMQEEGTAHLESLDNIDESKKNCGCGQDPCITYGKKEVRESKKDEKFKPHMMYDPKTGKGRMAKVEQDHKDMAKKGWGHDKPKKKDLEEAQSPAQKAAFQKMLDAKKGKKKDDSKDEEKEDVKKESADKHSEKICKDTVRNPNKEMLGGPSTKQAEKILIDKFGYTDKKIAKLKKEGIEFNEKRSVALKTVATDMVKKAKEQAKKAAK